MKKYETLMEKKNASFGQKNPYLLRRRKIGENDYF